MWIRIEINLLTYGSTGFSGIFQFRIISFLFIQFFYFINVYLLMFMLDDWPAPRASFWNDWNRSEIVMMVRYVTFAKMKCTTTIQQIYCPYDSDRSAWPIITLTIRISSENKRYAYKCWLNNLSHPRSQVPRYEKLTYESHLCKYYSKCFRIVANFMHRR